jgi:anaerobic selenocysteine-containing dehydrogenase
VADVIVGMPLKTSGQLLLEEYHALAMVGKGGLGTLTMDGNTRLCTATAATAMVGSETSWL